MNLFLLFCLVLGALYLFPIMLFISTGIDLELLDFCILFGAVCLCWGVWCLIYNLWMGAIDQTARLLKPRRLTMWEQLQRTPPLPFLLSFVHKKKSVWRSIWNVQWRSPSFLSGKSNSNQHFGISPTVSKVMDRHLWIQ